MVQVLPCYLVMLLQLNSSFLYGYLILHQICNHLLHETLNYPTPACGNTQGSI